jgi:hypothetical protein
VYESNILDNDVCINFFKCLPHRYLFDEKKIYIVKIMLILGLDPDPHLSQGLDPDLHSSQSQDPDPHIMNADPKHCRIE